MTKKFWKIWNRCTSVLVAGIVILTAVLIGPNLFGYHVFSVLSGSMEPELATGSLIYVKPVEPQQLQTGDVITYLLTEDTVVTHRIVGTVEGTDGVTRFRTKGDANDVEDVKLVHPANVIGTPVLSVPVLGRLAVNIQSKSGIYRAISAAAFLAMLVILPDLFTKEENGPEEPVTEG